MPATGTWGADALSSQILSTVRSDDPAWTGKLSVLSVINRPIEKQRQLSGALARITCLDALSIEADEGSHIRRYATLRVS